MCVSFLRTLSGMVSPIQRKQTIRNLPACESWEDVGNEIRTGNLRSLSPAQGRDQQEIDLVIRLFLILLDPAGAGFRQKFSKHHQNAIIAFDFPKKSDKRVTREVKDTERRGSFLFLQHSVFFYQQVDDRFRDIPGVFSRSPYTFRYIV